MAATGRVATKNPAAAKKPANAGPARIHAAPEDTTPGGSPGILRFSTKADSNGTNGQGGVRVPLFAVDDKEYTIPAYPDLSIGLEAMRLAGEPGIPVDYAATRSLVYILTAMLGEGGYQAMRTAPGMTKDDFAKLAAICRERAMGPLETPKDNSGSA
jgi:hypothetical protein